MHTTLAQKIVDVVSRGPCAKSELLEKLTKERGVTIQGVYKALKQLRAEEIVTVHKNTVSLSAVWIQKQFDHISEVASRYQAPVYQSYFGALKPGEKVTYRFKTLKELHAFWVHAIMIAVRGKHKEATIITLAPHDWFEYLRPGMSGMWDKVLGSHNPHLSIMTHSGVEEKKKSTHPGVRKWQRLFNVNPLKQKESVYINIVGNLIFEAHLDEPTVSKIRDVMVDKQVDVEKILSTAGKFRFTVVNDPRKANSYRKRLYKYCPPEVFKLEV